MQPKKLGFFNWDFVNFDLVPIFPISTHMPSIDTETSQLLQFHP
jgi:hypothetical protein